MWVDTFNNIFEFIILKERDVYIDIHDGCVYVWESAFERRQVYNG